MFLVASRQRPHPNTCFDCATKSYDCDPNFDLSDSARHFQFVNSCSDIEVTTWDVRVSMFVWERLACGRRLRTSVWDSSPTNTSISTMNVRVMCSVWENRIVRSKCFGFDYRLKSFDAAMLEIRLQDFVWKLSLGNFT